MSGGRIEGAAVEGNEYIRMTGTIRHTISAGLAHHIEELEGREDIGGIQVDLTGTLAIDSTNLGLLARLAKLQKRRGGDRVTLYSTNREITRIMESMGFDLVFRIVAAAPAVTPEYTHLSGDYPDDRDHGATILDAHQHLLDLDPKNRTEFGPLVEMLKRELRQGKP